MTLGLVLFASSGRDDAYITYWASHILATTGEIVNYSGDRVELSSSLTHVLLLAAGAKLLPWSVPTLGYVSSIVFGGITVYGTWRLASLVESKIACAATLLTASSTCLAYWSFGGLESTLVASLAIWLLSSSIHILNRGWSLARTLSTAGATTAFLLVRPEAVFVTLSVLLGALCLLLLRLRLVPVENRDESQEQVTRAGWLIAITLVLAAGILMFRVVYFDSVFPQPVSAKSEGTSVMSLVLGLRYLRTNAIEPIWGFVWPVGMIGAAVVLFASTHQSRRGPAEMMVALFVIAYLSFVVLSGGDWMEGGRFLVPVLPMTMITAAMLLRSVLVPQVHRPVLCVLAVLQISGTLLFARQTSAGSPIWTIEAREQSGETRDFASFERSNKVHRRDIPVATRLPEVVRELQQRYPGPVSILSRQMGMVMYYTTLAHFPNVRVLDLHGLASRDFTLCPTTSQLSRGPFGLDVSYEYFFANLDELQASCNISPPDVIFDLMVPNGPDFESLIRNNGWTIVYTQTGTIRGSSTLFPGAPEPAGQLIAVRSDLL